MPSFCSVVSVEDDLPHFSPTRKTSSNSVPDSVLDLWSPGTYSSIDRVRLQRCATARSDSGNESVDSAFSDGEQAFSRDYHVVLHARPASCGPYEARHRAENVLHISISSSAGSDIQIRHRALMPSDQRAYRVVAWGEERPSPGRIEDYRPGCASPEGTETGPRPGACPLSSEPIQPEARAAPLHSAFSSSTCSVRSSRSWEPPASLTCSPSLARPTPATIPPWSAASLIHYRNAAKSANKDADKPTARRAANVPAAKSSLPLSKACGEMDSTISPTTFRFYDRHMQEQSSLSKRISAQLLQKSAMRSSIANSHSSDRIPVSMSCLPKPSGQQSRAWTVGVSDRVMAERVDPQAPAAQGVITVAARQKCAKCRLELGHGQAMAIEDLALFFHMHCFRCERCGLGLSSRSEQGTSVLVAGREVRCRHCFDRAEAGFQSSRI